MLGQPRFESLEAEQAAQAVELLSALILAAERRCLGAPMSRGAAASSPAPANTPLAASGAHVLPMAAHPIGKAGGAKTAVLSRFRVVRARPTVLVVLVLRGLRDRHGEAAARASCSGGGGVVERA
jgi:hypothetical protein